MVWEGMSDSDIDTHWKSNTSRTLNNQQSILTLSKYNPRLTLFIRAIFLSGLNNRTVPSSFLYAFMPSNLECVLACLRTLSLDHSASQSLDRSIARTLHHSPSFTAIPP